jgi:hypothetical protein
VSYDFWELQGYALPITLHLRNGETWDFTVEDEEFAGIYDQITAIMWNYVDR